MIDGFAALTHGASFLTRDVDVCVVLSPENVARLRETFRDWNPRHRMTPQRLSFLTHPEEGQPLQNLYLETDHGIIDFLSSVLGVGDFSRLRERAEIVEVDGKEYPIIGLADLITAKEALSRDKDVMTAKELRVIAAKRGIALDSKEDSRLE
ncbi:nucleotidyltransferase [Synoicihabitans lomoniglobus]|uniref:Nucleotidyltransferase n=1 Tax=Synoicihabitans lomoniglobus TaxID=2909285 RepID=A0AAE9ZVG6_9BACT|nr:nucleotidyltransferase [Opitutaceae bacterium LMO-M01]WED64827.1 nucleotidyltransferase [Opitutaceae bacterium LMO-M01]